MDHEKFQQKAWHGWMISTRYHEQMAERLDLNIGVWQVDKTRIALTRAVGDMGFWFSIAR